MVKLVLAMTIVAVTSLTASPLTIGEENQSLKSNADLEEGRTINLITDVTVREKIVWVKSNTKKSLFQNFISATCGMMRVPCTLCDVPVIGPVLCPQPVPIVCFVCRQRSVDGLTEYIKGQNVTMSMFEIP